MCWKTVRLALEPEAALLIQKLNLSWLWVLCCLVLGSADVLLIQSHDCCWHKGAKTVCLPMKATGKAIKTRQNIETQDDCCLLSCSFGDISASETRKSEKSKWNTVEKHSVSRKISFKLKRTWAFLTRVPFSAWVYYHFSLVSVRS